MALFRRCFCWKDVRTGSVASGVFTLTFALLQLLLQVALWTAAASAPRTTSSTDSVVEVLDVLEVSQQWLEDRPYYVVYIALAGLDVILIIMSIIMLVGLDKDYKGRTWLLPWVVFLPLYVLYETAINIYMMVYAFDGSKLGWPFVLPVMIAIYWFIKLVINIAGFICVISRYQELSKYGRILAKRSSYANSFDREYPNNNYFASMATTRSGWDDDRGHKKHREHREHRHHDRYEQSKDRYEQSNGRYEQSNGRSGHSHQGREYAPRHEHEYRSANGYYRY